MNPPGWMDDDPVIYEPPGGDAKLSWCPYKPGTKYWKRWQQDFIDVQYARGDNLTARPRHEKLNALVKAGVLRAEENKGLDKLAPDVRALLDDPGVKKYTQEYPTADDLELVFLEPEFWEKIKKLWLEYQRPGVHWYAGIKTPTTADEDYWLRWWVGREKDKQPTLNDLMHRRQWTTGMHVAYTFVLRGGPYDGEVMAVGQLGTRLRFPWMSDRRVLGSYNSSLVMPTFHSIEYAIMDRVAPPPPRGVAVDIWQWANNLTPMSYVYLCNYVAPNGRIVT